MLHCTTSSLLNRTCQLCSLCVLDPAFPAASRYGNAHELVCKMKTAHAVGGGWLGPDRASLRHYRLTMFDISIMTRARAAGRSAADICKLRIWFSGDT